MGLEPTTFCMASGSWVRPFAARGRMVKRVDVPEARQAVSLMALVCRGFLEVWALERLSCPNALQGLTERATSAHLDSCRVYRDRFDHEDYEIVLVGADSRETLEVTHSRYFKKSEPVPF